MISDLVVYKHVIILVRTVNNIPKCVVYFDLRKVKALELLRPMSRGRLIGRIICTPGESVRSERVGHALAIVVHGSKYNRGGDNCYNSGNCVTEMCGDSSLET
ncbi:hypothetical protein CEXT_568771 [Caerostris extrusa]|uniref:Uncharacterized protein n=1 Tax=Caerostris extrusa TaxID=172846 RepID=A0AAV4NJE6_CAEEX|nr:hypothetical protein CEXT_568771 [Caerostris extrusa]